MKRIVFDPGHGGHDTGATGNGLVEKDLNLKVALACYHYMDKNFRCRVDLTRDRDEFLSPDERVKRVTNINPDLCVSIHHNGATACARGGEVIHAHYDEWDDPLALGILKRWNTVLGLPTRRAFTKLNSRGGDWYYMIRRIWDNDTHAIITECGFVTNKDDANIMSTAVFVEYEAQTICEEIAENMGLERKVYIEVMPEDWKLEGLVDLHTAGLIHDVDTWGEKIDEPAPVWFVTTVLNNLYKEIKDNEKR